MFTVAKLVAALTIAAGVLAVQFVDRTVVRLPRF